jgi:hypothetical protein
MNEELYDAQETLGFSLHSEYIPVYLRVHASW